jgi:hypothetical protein
LEVVEIGGVVAAVLVEAVAMAVVAVTVGAADAVAAAAVVAVVAVAAVAVVAPQDSESYVGAYGPAGTAHFWVLTSADNPVSHKLTGAIIWRGKQ